jgi:hypothetical protein
VIPKQKRIPGLVEIRHVSGNEIRNEGGRKGKREGGKGRKQTDFSRKKGQDTLYNRAEVERCNISRTFSTQKLNPWL